ncbi:response regulator [Desulfovibrio aerotolerans]|uniref:Response regulator n=1 Tax=Solidesulfovibrio aerotolerans TaxID=295255 RepID=A0A7C9IP29_9BACT|nr:HD domain-containing phosphohydrolase [Solidesulfovibrio aerotolerans]MYL84746.1 response regulator [Solidesulfovibrio aerotolerans]
MSKKILIVDDEKNLLDSLRRSLSRRYDVVMAQGPEAGLAALQSKDSFAVVVSDLAMPGMDGVKFLAKTRDISPLSIRMMLTGHGDLDAAIAAVNEGNIFRFLTKPCPIESLVRALDAGLEQYRLVTAEKELLRGTLRGCIKVLTDILNLVNPEAFSRGERVKRLMMAVVRTAALANPLKFELAGMLSQIGMVAIPQDIVFKRFRGEQLSAEENQIYGMHAAIATSLLSQIPRLNDVVEIVSCQNECFSQGTVMSEGAVLINLCLEYDDLEQLGVPKDQAIASLRPRWEARAPAVFTAFEKVLFSDEGYVPKRVAFKTIQAGMIIQQDLFDAQGLLIMAKGQELSDIAILRLTKMSESFKLPKELDVLVPL